MTVRDDLELVAWDLATVCGALSEIATTWRRASAGRPGRPGRRDLPLDLPVRLADMAQRLAADTRVLAGTGPEHAPDLAESVAPRIAELSEGTARARSMTAGGAGSCVGDAPLWDVACSALRRAGDCLALA